MATRQEARVAVGAVCLVFAANLAARLEAAPPAGWPAYASAVVAVDGSGQFRSLQAAIAAAPSARRERPWTIHVKPGVYHERLYVQREKTFLAIVGEDPETTIVRYDLHANVAGPDGRPIGTFRTPTAQIDADDFSAENVTFENAAGPVGQALAVRVDGDRAAFRNCRFVGWQDTVFLNRGRHYFEDCFISGHVDFIFGGATAFFERCKVLVRRDGYVTAASTPAEQPHGFVFRGGSIRGETLEARTYLGRPWRSFASTVFLETEMTEVVRPEGWHNWARKDRERTVRYAEHASSGPGAKGSERVPWARQLTAEQAAALTPARVLAGADGWDPQAEGSAVSRAATRAAAEPPRDARADCPAPARFTPDVDYGAAGGETLRLDVCRPPGKGPFPAALLVHGGGWIGGNRKQAARDLVGPLVRAGVAWVAIGYRLAPKHRYPAAVEDVEAAIRWLKRRAGGYRIDAGRLALVGESAGGHLVAAAAVRAKDDTRVAAVVPFFAPVDLEVDGERRGGMSASMRALFGRSDLDEASRALLREASPIAHVLPGLPPFLLVHGTADMSVPYEQSQRMQKALRAAGVPCELITIPDGTHGTRGWDALDPAWRHAVIAWLTGTLGAGGASEAGKARRPIRIALVGDSTVTDETGWGLGFKAHLAPRVVCSNRARGGRSSKSYRDEGLWQAVLAERPDYVLVQFGHNDQPGKGPQRETDPATGFRDNLARYVDEARAAGAQPVLVTSLTRRLFGADGRIHSNLGAYVEATKAVAAAKGVSLVDLHARSVELLDALGAQAAARLDEIEPDGSVDRTHLRGEGSRLFGALVAQELRRVRPELADSVSAVPVARAREPRPERREPDAPGAARALREAPWVPDQGDGTYRNPVLFLDVSDPDAIRVGDTYYLVASTFSHAPGLTLLESKDLVNWSYLASALPRLEPAFAFARPSRGNGVWAPAIRHRQGRFRIYFPDPDRGIFVTTAEDPKGPWTPPVVVKAGTGLIDPCPFWDDDGQGWLVHAWARSRAGFANALTLDRLSEDGLHVVGEGRTLIDGNAIPGYGTLEGPKLYKRNGYYYVFAPAGGVKRGWQSVFRSRTITGPYEQRIVLDQGRTDVNGPHQGAWVDTVSGQDWFLHFQDREAFGRVVHLQPLRWQDDWPVIGRDEEGDGRGEPVPGHRKPEVARPTAPSALPTSDDFAAALLGPQWQWEANPREGSHELGAGHGLRLFSQRTDPGDRLWSLPGVLGQRLPGPAAVATTVVRFAPQAEGERAGLVVLGLDYSWIGLRKTAGGIEISRIVCRNPAQEGSEEVVASAPAPAGPVYLRVEVDAQARGRFSYSLDNRTFTLLGPAFQAVPGRWVGARLGLFAAAAPASPATGHADFGWILVTRPASE